MHMMRLITCILRFFLVGFSLYGVIGDKIVFGVSKDNAIYVFLFLCCMIPDFLIKIETCRLEKKPVLLIMKYWYSIIISIQCAFGILSSFYIMVSQSLSIAFVIISTISFIITAGTLFTDIVFYICISAPRKKVLLSDSHNMSA